MHPTRPVASPPSRRFRVAALGLVVLLVGPATGAFAVASRDETPAARHAVHQRSRAARVPDCRTSAAANLHACSHGGDAASSIGAVPVTASGGRGLAARWWGITGPVAQVQAGLFDTGKVWPASRGARDLSPVAATNDQAPVLASGILPSQPWRPEPLRADMPGQPPCFYNRDNGPLVEVIYAVPAGRTDFWAYMRTAIPPAMERVDSYVAMSSVALQGQVTRRVKFLMWSSTCTLAVKHVSVPAGTDTWKEAVGALARLGFDDYRKRRYVVFLQAREAAHPDGYCGQGAAGVAVIFNLCSDADLVTEHELAHALGAIGPPGAPHRSGDGHYTDGFDRMVGESRYGSRFCANRSYDVLLDCGGDDYFNPLPRLGSWLRRNVRYNIAYHPVLWGVQWHRVWRVTYSPARPMGVRAPGASMCKWATIAKVNTSGGVTSLGGFGGRGFTARITGTPRRSGNTWTARLEIVGKRSLTRVKPTIRAYNSQSPQPEGGQVTAPLTLLKGTC
jgi:hypothetical protein